MMQLRCSFGLPTGRLRGSHRVNSILHCPQLAHNSLVVEHVTAATPDVERTAAQLELIENERIALDDAATAASDVSAAASRPRSSGVVEALPLVPAVLLYQQQRYAAATELLERLAGDAEALAEGTAVRVLTLLLDLYIEGRQLPRAGRPPAVPDLKLVIRLYRSRLHALAHNTRAAKRELKAVMSAESAPVPQQAQQQAQLQAQAQAQQQLQAAALRPLLLNNLGLVQQAQGKHTLALLYLSQHLLLHNYGAARTCFQHAAAHYADTWQSSSSSKLEQGLALATGSSGLADASAALSEELAVATAAGGAGGEVYVLGNAAALAALAGPAALAASYTNLGAVFASQGEMGQAAALVRQALALQPASRRAQLLAVYCQLQLGDSVDTDTAAALRHQYAKLTLGEKRLLCLAASSGDAESLEAALANCGCAIPPQALAAAAAAGHLAACERLLRGGATVSLKSVMAAARDGHLPVLQLLMKNAGAMRRDREAWRGLIDGAAWAACAGGHAAILAWLQQEHRYRVERDAVQGAAEGGQLGLLEAVLLPQPLPVLQRMGNSHFTLRTILVGAARHADYLPRLKWLLAAGYPITPAMAASVAVEGGHADALVFLWDECGMPVPRLQHGAPGHVLLQQGIDDVPWRLPAVRLLWERRVLSTPEELLRHSVFHSAELPDEALLTWLMETVQGACGGHAAAVEPHASKLFRFVAGRGVDLPLLQLLHKRWGALIDLQAVAAGGSLDALEWAAAQPASSLKRAVLATDELERVRQQGNLANVEWLKARGLIDRSLPKVDVMAQMMARMMADMHA
eukprot:XP_001694383.1 predicted protein [Chlamydomonas reinhardtii]